VIAILSPVTFHDLGVPFIPLNELAVHRLPGGGYASRKTNDALLTAPLLDAVATSVRSTTGNWGSGNSAFAISHGPCGTTPSASSGVSRFSDMLFSPTAFAFRSIGWPRGISSEPLLTVSGIQPRVPRRTLSTHTAPITQGESPRKSRRQISLSQAAAADSSSWR
jgi:hypothetical protein